MSTTNNGNLEIHALNSTGLPGRFLGSRAYDCTTRPWYITAQSTMTTSWTAPFIQASNNIPAVSFVVPIITTDSYAGRSGFVGALSFNVQLTLISQYLMHAYSNSSNSVFIVEKSSGYLIASSQLAKSYATVAGVNVSLRILITGTTMLCLLHYMRVIRSVVIVSLLFVRHYVC